MGYIFCQSCGSKAEYNFAPPNFCAKCGQRYHTNTNQSKQLLSKSKFAKQVSRIETDDSDDEDYDDYDDSGESDFSDSTIVPRIKNISVEIDSSSNVRSFKLGELFESQQLSQNFPFGKRQNLE